MKNFLSRFFKVLFLSSLAALIAVSCSKTDGPGGDDDPDDGTVPPEWACTLKSISFAPKDNPTPVLPPPAPTVCWPALTT